MWDLSITLSLGIRELSQRQRSQGRRRGFIGPASPDTSSVQNLLSFLLLHQDYYQFISTIYKVQCPKATIVLYLAATEFTWKVCSPLLSILPSRHSKMRFSFLVQHCITAVFGVWGPLSAPAFCSVVFWPAKQFCVCAFNFFIHGTANCVTVHYSSSS